MIPSALFDSTRLIRLDSHFFGKMRMREAKANPDLRDQLRLW